MTCSPSSSCIKHTSMKTAHIITKRKACIKAESSMKSMQDTATALSLYIENMAANAAVSAVVTRNALVGFLSIMDHLP